MHALIRLVCAAVIAAPMAARADTLIFNADTSDPAPKAAWESVVKQFEAANPNIHVQFNVYDHESYKSSIRNWLTSEPPDVALWYSGERMVQFVRPGLLLDISDIWTPEARKQFPDKVLATVTVDGKQYGVPYAYYQWGIYFRRDIFQKLGVQPIHTWDDLLAACDKIKAAGLEPIDIGTKDLWMTGGWFDYLDLRINGYDFHMQLMRGKVSWEDPRLASVFAHWKQLIDKQCFVKTHTSLSWQEAQSLLYQGKAGMILIGNFITQGFPPEVTPNIDFVPFPVVTPGVADGEEAPTESIHIPAHARNVADAKKLLQFVMQPDTQSELAATEKLLPANSDAKVLDDRFLQAGQRLLSGAAHLTQFLDRDTSEDLANVAMKGFQEFMVKPNRLNSVLRTIERARARIYASN